MNNRKNLAGETGFFNLYTLIVALIAICAVGTAVMLAPPECSELRARSVRRARRFRDGVSPAGDKSEAFSCLCPCILLAGSPKLSHALIGYAATS